MPTGLRLPVLVTGPHRSGTTLVARLLEQLGLWLGPNLDPNAEAVYFLRRNEGLLRAAGGAWDRPGPMADWLAVPGRLEAVARHLADELDTRRLVELCGRDLLRRPRRQALRGPWGFKDPRLLFTLPVWRRVFPRAPLVVVRRDGVQAAASLWRRERAREDRSVEELLDLGPLPARAGAFPWRRPPLEPYLLSARCQELEGAHDLWSEYARAAEGCVAVHDGPVCELTLEGLVADPVGELGRLAAFAGLEPTEGALRAAAAGVLAERALGPPEEPEVLRLRRRLERDGVGGSAH